VAVIPLDAVVLVVRLAPYLEDLAPPRWLPDLHAVDDDLVTRYPMHRIFLLLLVVVD
jgi:hypothetical protein